MHTVLNTICYGVRGGAVGWRTALTSRKDAGSIPDGVFETFH